MKRYRIPQAIRDAYRDRDLIRPGTRPYSEIVRDLDAVADMPEAASPEVQELLARDRLRLLHYCADATDEEIEDVLQRHGSTLDAMHPIERRWTLVNVTQGRHELAERYLAPMLAEIESAVAAKDMLESALAVARGESQQPEPGRKGAWDYDFGLMVARSESETEDEREMSEGIRRAYRLQQLGFPYEDVIAAWDRLKPSEPGTANWITHHRLSVTVDYQQPDGDLEREIERALEVFAGQPIEEWARWISHACATYPALAEKYIPPLIAELEEKHDQPDEEREEALGDLRDDLERARSTDPGSMQVLGWPLRDRQPIAMRALKANDGRVVWFEIYAPEPDRESPHGGWRCAFRLSGAIDVDQYGHSLDALGALVNAIMGVRYYLDQSGLVLTWDDMETGDHGVPMVVQPIFGLAFTRELEAEIHRRMAAYRPPWAPPANSDGT